MVIIAPPPAGPPPALTPRGRTAVRVTFVTVAAVVALSVVTALGALAWAVSSFRVVTDGRSLPAGMRQLVVDTGNVPVALRITADREAREPRVELRLVNTIRSGDHPLSVTSDAAGTRIALGGESSPILEWARGGEITVTVPPELSRQLTVTTRQQTGMLSVAADLDELVARTDDGLIVLSGAARRVDVQTANGEVMTRDGISVRESFRADTADGDVIVDFNDAAPRTVQATSQDGDVVLALPGRGPFVVNASTGVARGDTVIRVPQTADHDSAAAVVTARSNTGDVTVEERR